MNPEINMVTEKPVVAAEVNVKAIAAVPTP